LAAGGKIAASGLVTRTAQARGAYRELGDRVIKPVFAAVKSSWASVGRLIGKVGLRRQPYRQGGPAQQPVAGRQKQTEARVGKVGLPRSRIKAFPIPDKGSMLLSSQADPTRVPVHQANMFERES